MTRTRNDLVVGFLSAYDEQISEPPAELVIPEDLGTLSDADLTGLVTQAREAFAALYNGGSVAAEDMETLQALTENIEALSAEQTVRDEAAAERAQAAAALASRALPEGEGDGDGDDAEAGDDEEKKDGDDDEEKAEGEGDAEDAADTEGLGSEVVTAGATPARPGMRLNMSSIRSRQAQAQAQAQIRRAEAPQTIRDVAYAAPNVPGFSQGAGMDFMDMARAVDHRLSGFNKAAFDSAKRSGRHIQQQYGIAQIRKPFTEDLRIVSDDQAHVEAVMSRAADESRLPGGSLVASGGWCAPSETLWDLYETETRDGLFSLPEVAVTRGGIRFPSAVDFSTLFSGITGFSYTEAQDVAGEYGVDANGVGNDTEGTKPCHVIDCPDFEEVRLGLEGLCLSAGLLQRRGFPEYIARFIRGALVAHDHKIAGRRLASIAAGSTAITFPSGQVGAIAPILTALELQIEHYRTAHRLSRSQSLEAVFPFWVRGAIRADLSRRLGMNVLSVSDAQISAWFAERGANAQFVYNWDDLTGDPTTATAFPTEVKFLLYAAGTWVAGASDVITVDTLMDSTLLGSNDYIALFTEEGVLVAKRGVDSRVVSVPICPDGATAAGVAIACNGTEVVETPEEPEEPEEG